MREFVTGIGVGVIAVLTLLAILGISFLITSGIIFLICWAFTVTFTWKIALGVWLVIILLRSIFKITVNNKDK